MSVKLPPVHLLFRHFLAFFLVLFFFGAFVSLVSCVPTLEAPSFFYQLVSFFDHQSVDVHSIRISFPSWEIVLLLWGFVFPTSSSCSFNSLIDLGMSVIQFGCPLIPVSNGFEWSFKFHQLERQTPG
jgi:hypothetical protein